MRPAALYSTPGDLTPDHVRAELRTDGSAGLLCVSTTISRSDKSTIHIIDLDGDAETIGLRVLEAMDSGPHPIVIIACMTEQVVDPRIATP